MTTQKAVLEHGVKLLHDPLRNKGTAFTAAEREALGLRGLLPPRICPVAVQAARALDNIRKQASDLDRYLALVSLQDRNETLYYRLLIENIAELMPYIYTPTVGQACQQFCHIYRRPRGLYISMEDRGRVADILANWPHQDVRIIVITDGERILGLGDLGAAGMGIPIGKLALYTACAGIHPAQCLPIMLDVGTQNETLLNDPLYLGLERHRERGPGYDSLVAEFMDAARQRFPNVLVQLEDFGNSNAFRLLQAYRERLPLFDDDIQGTGAVGLAGLLSALRITGGALEEQRILLVGAGQAGLGIGNAIVAALQRDGMEAASARQRCWFFDSGGLLVASRDHIAPQKRDFAHEAAADTDLLSCIETLRPSVLIGCAGVGGYFSQAAIEAMAGINERPIIFALSNPTSKAECSAEQAYQWSDGRAVFASGSPFEPVVMADRRLVPGQGNNAYIFPGVGLGALFSGTRQVTDSMFLAAARALAGQVDEEDLAQGRVYPPLASLREVSARIALAVTEVAIAEGLSSLDPEQAQLASIRDAMYQPVYPHYA